MEVSWIQPPIFHALLLILIERIPVSEQGANERRLLENIFNKRDYNKLERPVANESDALRIVFGLVLQQIIEVDEKNQILHTNIWLNLVWNDSNLSWNESEYGGIKSVRIPPSMIWKPDILMYNSADEDIDSTFPTNVVVSSPGTCLWVPPGLFLSTCKIDIQWFPFDDQRCTMKFGSWTYDSSDIDLTIESETGDISSFIENGEWQLLGVEAQRNVKKYECCPEQYIDVTFTIHIRRRTLYYGFNLIIPCVLISSMTLLTFTLPPDAGEKISLGVTVLLSLTVFLLLVAETMPPTSDAVPLIGMYFSAIMLMCSLSVVCTVLVLNFHHRSPETHVMPYWIKKGICETLARILWMRRPGGLQQSTSSRKHAIRARLKELQLRERSSQSLLANVLDLDDLMLLRANFSSTHFPSSTVRPEPPTNVQFINRTFQPDTGQKPPDCDSSESLLREILLNVRQVTAKLKREDERQDECSDWKFAAMVIDRLCLCLFTMFTFVSTFAILFSSPHVLA